MLSFVVILAFDFLNTFRQEHLQVQTSSYIHIVKAMTISIYIFSFVIKYLYFLVFQLWIIESRLFLHKHVNVNVRWCSMK